MKGVKKRKSSKRTKSCVQPIVLEETERNNLSLGTNKNNKDTMPNINLDFLGLLEITFIKNI